MLKITKINDKASTKQTLQALIDDEQSAISSYDVAIANLKDALPDISLKALIAIRNDERQHVENLYAIMNNTVTEKNLHD